MFCLFMVESVSMGCVHSNGLSYAVEFRYLSSGFSRCMLLWGES